MPIAAASPDSAMRAVAMTHPGRCFHVARLFIIVCSPIRTFANKLSVHALPLFAAGLLSTQWLGAQIHLRGTVKTFDIHSSNENLLLLVVNFFKYNAQSLLTAYLFYFSL